MKREQVLSRRERDLNTPGQLRRSIAISAAAHLLAALLVVAAGRLASGPKPIVPSPYMVKLVTAPKAAPRSLLEEKQKKPPAPEKKSPKRAKKVKREKLPVEKKIEPAGKKIVPVKEKKAPAPPPAKKEPPPAKKQTPEPKEPDKAEPMPPPSKTVVTEGTYFPYVWYLKIMERKVTESWITHGIDITGKRADPVVRFRITRDGSVTGLRMERSSGSSALDQSAIDAVMSAAPFPPLPEGFEGGSLGVHFAFNYEQHER
ncbi:MAG: energy transducer TonB [Candidatus Nitrospinota bacterium M3_3B_026]